MTLRSWKGMMQEQPQVGLGLGGSCQRQVRWRPQPIIWNQPHSITCRLTFRRFRALGAQGALETRLRRCTPYIMEQKEGSARVVSWTPLRDTLTMLLMYPSTSGKEDSLWLVEAFLPPSRRPFSRHQSRSAWRPHEPSRLACSCFRNLQAAVGGALADCDWDPAMCLAAAPAGKKRHAVSIRY